MKYLISGLVGGGMGLAVSQAIFHGFPLLGFGIALIGIGVWLLNNFPNED